MKPQVKDLHIDRLLTQISIGYQDASFISDLVLPRVSVDKQSNKYYVFGRSFDVVDDRVRPGGRAKEIEWDFSTDTFFCEGHAIAEAVADRQSNNADPGLDLEANAAENTMQTILRNKEKACADKVFALASYDSGLRTTLSGTTQWSDYTNSNPMDVIENAKQSVVEQIGLEPNTLVLGAQTWRGLRKHTGLMTYFNAVEKRLLTVAMLKELLEIDNIIIGRAQYNSAKQGRTESLGYIWGKHAALLYVPPRPAQKTPAFGYTFVWDGANGNQEGVVTYKYREEGRHSDIVENELYYDHKQTVQKAGYFWLDAVA